jgi:hypothetical protein
VDGGAVRPDSTTIHSTDGVNMRGERIEAIHAFLGSEALERFGSPSRLD